MNQTKVGGTPAHASFSKSPLVATVPANFVLSAGATSRCGQGIRQTAGWKRDRRGRGTGVRDDLRLRIPAPHHRFTGAGITFDGNPIQPETGQTQQQQRLRLVARGRRSLLAACGLPAEHDQERLDREPSGAAAATGAVTTTFRININGTNKATGVFAVDNIVFTGCGVPNPPTMAKSFLPTRWRPARLPPCSSP